MLLKTNFLIDKKLVQKKGTVGESRLVSGIAGLAGLAVVSRDPRTKTLASPIGRRIREFGRYLPRMQITLFERPICMD